MWLEIGILILQILLVLMGLCYILYSVARGISGYLDVPFVATPHRALPQIADALAIGPKDVVYDLGCGDGRLLFYCALRNPDAQFVGIERNALLVTYAKAKQWMLDVPNISFRREDILDTDLYDATRVYTFLLPELMTRLFSKEHNAAPRCTLGARVVSRAFAISDFAPLEMVELPNSNNTFGENRLYIYAL